MNEIKPMLLEFLQPDDFFKTILIVESVNYLPKLRQIYPNAEIHAVIKDSEVIEKFNGLDIKFHELDYREERLPFEEEFFDVIIGDLTASIIMTLLSVFCSAYIDIILYIVFAIVILAILYFVIRVVIKAVKKKKQEQQNMVDNITKDGEN